MSPDELLTLATSSVNRCIRGEVSIIADLNLILTVDTPPSGGSIPYGDDGPVGEVVAVKPSAKMPGLFFVTATFPALAMARHLLDKAEEHERSRLRA